MGKMVEKIKERILNEVLSLNELENIMLEYGYRTVENDDENDNVIKFTNYSSQIWVYSESDNTDVLITKVSSVNRIESEQTKVDPFHSFEDLMKIMNYFKDNKMYNHWITAWLMTSLGRRVGDTIKLKWSDLYRKNGTFRTRLTQLKEEKTGKKLSPILNALAKNKIEQYIYMVDISPMKNYNEQIVNTSSAAFRKALKKAVEYAKLQYPISTHSFRKFYGNTLAKLHPQDADKLTVIQSIFGHSSDKITKIYIGDLDEKQDKYNQDFSDYMLAMENGEQYNISNSPIVAIKSEDFRELLSKCFDMASNGMDKFKTINELLNLTETLIV